MTFTISEAYLARRNRNILVGALLSLLLIALVVSGHAYAPRTYNAVLMWSMIGFLVIANFVNYLRFIRYLKRARSHRVVVSDRGVEFVTAGEKSVLHFADVAALVKHGRRGRLSHLQVKLRNNRGIRLEGYDTMEGLSEAMEAHIPAAHVMSR